MSTPYEYQLRAIRELLDSSSQEVIREGYDLLFSLWLENMDSADFQQDLALIAMENPNIIKEFEQRINALVVREKITDIYLRLQLKKVSSKVQKLKAARSRGRKKAKKSEEAQQDSSKNSDEKQAIQEIKPRSKKIFISYSHKDEIYKDELVTILIPLQDEGVLEIWQDREIIPGDEWYEAIQSAMNSCELALLLISGDFLASRFIRDKELTRLFQRRKEAGLRVVPIIIRSCKWQSVPILKGIQALPKDGKPVISFEGAGERDRVWTEVATAIESICIGIKN